MNCDIVGYQKVLYTSAPLPLNLFCSKNFIFFSITKTVYFHIPYSTATENN